MLIEFDWVLVLVVMIVIFAGVATAYNLMWWWAPLTTIILMLGFALTGMVYVTSRFMLTDVLITWLPISLLLALIATVIRIYIEGKSKRLIQWLTIISISVISVTGLFTYTQGLTTMDEAVLENIGEENITGITVTKRVEPGNSNRVRLEEDEQIEGTLNALSGVELNRYYQIPPPRSDITLELMSNQGQKRLEFYVDEQLVKIDRYVYEMDSDEMVPLLLDERWSFES